MNLKNTTRGISSTVFHMNQWIKAVMKDCSCLDMTGNVGSESIYLIQKGIAKHADIYELDKETFKQLRENITCLKAPLQQKIDIFNESSLNNAGKYDVILCDPPWGGFDYAGNKAALVAFRSKCYKDKKFYLWTGDIVELKLGHLLVSDLVNEMIKQKKFKQLFLKIPINSTMSPYIKNFIKFPNERFILIKEKEQIKYVVCLIQIKD